MLIIMNIIDVVILGLVEGITEFLPISSTAHLILVSKIIGLQQTEFLKFFEVFIQSGAIMAVILSYFYFIKKNIFLLKKIFFSFLPTAIGAVVFYKLIKNIFFESYLLIVSSMVIIGFLFIFLEFLIKKKLIQLHLSLDQLTNRQAILIGIAQGLAIIPGVSRAGAVILMMMFLGFNRKDSVLYSFVLAVPTIISAGLYDFLKIGISNFNTNNNFVFLVIGFFVSFLSALFTIKWFINYLQKNNLILFGSYRIILGLILLFYFL